MCSFEFNHGKNSQQGLQSSSLPGGYYGEFFGRTAAKIQVNNNSELYIGVEFCSVKVCVFAIEQSKLMLHCLLPFFLFLSHRRAKKPIKINKSKNIEKFVLEKVKLRQTAMTKTKVEDIPGRTQSEMEVFNKELIAEARRRMLRSKVFDERIQEADV